jgi:hypothetical protein
MLIKTYAGLSGCALYSYQSNTALNTAAAIVMLLVRLIVT